MYQIFTLSGRWTSDTSSSFTGQITFNFDLTQKNHSYVTLTLDNPKLAQVYHYPKRVALETICWTTTVLEEQHFYIIARPRRLTKYLHSLFQLRNVQEDLAGTLYDEWEGHYQSLYPKDQGQLQHLSLSSRHKRPRPK